MRPRRRERIDDDLGLQRALPFVADVRQHRSAARAVGSTVDAIRRPLQDVSRDVPTPCRAGPFRSRRRPPRRESRRPRTRPRLRGAQSCGRPRPGRSIVRRTRSPRFITRASRNAAAPAGGSRRAVIARRPRRPSARETAPAPHRRPSRRPARWSGSRAASASAASVSSISVTRCSNASRASPRTRAASGRNRIERSHRRLERRANDRAGLVAAAQHREARQRAVDLRSQRSPRARCRHAAPRRPARPPHRR